MAFVSLEKGLNYLKTPVEVRGYVTNPQERVLLRHTVHYGEGGMESGVRYLIDDEPMMLAEDGSFSFNVKLEEGRNSIRAFTENYYSRGTDSLSIEVTAEGKASSLLRMGPEGQGVLTFLATPRKLP